MCLVYRNETDWTKSYGLGLGLQSTVCGSLTQYETPRWHATSSHIAQMMYVNYNQLEMFYNLPVCTSAIMAVCGISDDRWSEILGKQCILWYPNSMAIIKIQISKSRLTTLPSKTSLCTSIHWMNCQTVWELTGEIMPRDSLIMWLLQTLHIEMWYKVSCNNHGASSSV